MRRVRRFFLFALALVVGVATLVVAAWALDTSRSQDKVARHVSIAGQDVSGLRRAELAGVIAGLARSYGGQQLQVDAPGGGFTIDPAEIGLAVDQSATIDAVLDVGRSGNPLNRISGWLTSFLHDRKPAVRLAVDRAAVYKVVAERDTGRTPPTEPRVKAEKGRLVTVDGVPGKGVDPASLLEALSHAGAEGAPATVKVELGPVPPRFDVVDAARLVDAGEAATEKALPVTVDGQPGDIPGAELRSWLRSVTDDNGLRLAVDTVKATADVSALLPDVGTPAVETAFTVVDNVPQIVPGTPGTACCAPDAGAQIDAAMQARLSDKAAAEPVALPARPREPNFTVEEATALGVKEVVGTFTTNHAPNQPRVSNIHKISDLVRGQVIMPGKTFSVNDFVGKRTEEKGFVVDHVIEDGKFTESVGGGISQFATTTFNAAFFAGLEFPEYQSHSLYISRYPFGREATLSYPHPDLKIRNPSPHGVLIWPTYTGRSVTVTLFSTKWVEATQTNQTKEPRGPCTLVRTERTRRYLADNTTKIDRVNALYRPAEGVNCT
ncbi:MAG: VanW family protein [Acidimicrobiales bacterium]